MTQVIDAHCHASPVWFEPVEPLILQMDMNGVRQAVLTQALGQYDNAYQEDCLKRYPGRFASVVGVDPDSPEAPEALVRAARAGAVGVRLRPDIRSAADDPLRLWRVAADAGMVVSCAGSPASLLDGRFSDLLRTFPSMTFALEHLGGWTRGDCDRSEAVREGIMSLADFPNVVLKVPALGQLAPRDMRGRLPASGCVLDKGPAAILLDALRRFGGERMMWGSDYPPVSSREGYANALNWTREIFAECSRGVVDDVFGATAKRVFSLE